MLSGAVPHRRWLLRGAVVLLTFVLVGWATAATVGYERTDLGAGTVERTVEGQTVVSVQGFHLRGVGNTKKPARLVSVTSEGDLDWVSDGSRRGVSWFYDVDPLANGNLLVTSTRPGETVVYELDPDSRERVWTERFDIEDTHDVAKVGDDELLVANMRNYDPGTGGNDRLFVYNLTTDEVVWEWQFVEHYPREAGGDYREDWTHVNDVEKVAEGEYLVSVRNFDQVIVVNRSTEEIDLRLGSDDDHATLYEQHNPDYIESESGTPTILVADSENDRVVEYARENGGWNRTWELTGNLNWPRDADRLPNGNTLVTDTLNHRVVEVTPRGEVVWEFYATWGPYDAERLDQGDRARNASASAGGTATQHRSGGSNGPTIADLNATGSYTIHGGAGEGPEATPGVGDWLHEQGLTWIGKRYAHVVPFVRPVWIPSWAFAGYVAAALLFAGWTAGELYYRRGHIRRRLGRLRERLSARTRT